MKKGYWFIALFSFMSSLSFVHAAPGLADSIARGSYGASQIISSAFGPFFGALLGSDPTYLFEHILIFLVIFCATYMAVKQIDILNSNKAITLIVSLSVAILAGRFMTVHLITALLLPYRSLGIVLTALLPVIIGFFFTHYGLKDYPILRKIFWIFFTVVFVAMWSENYFVAGPIAWMYFWTALICLLFFLFDGTIRRALIKQQMDQAGVDSNLKFARHIKDELYELHEQKRKGIIDDKEYYKIKKQLSKQLRNLAKY